MARRPAPPSPPSPPSEASVPDSPASPAATPALAALQVFEAAARHGSFTRAATELGISQPAVSHAMRQLESGLGVQLFERLHKGVKPTASGLQLMEQVAAALGMIDQALRALRHGDSTPVTLAVSTATATWWLMPRIARFKALHPEVVLRCITTDTDLDLERERIDLAITLGSDSFTQYQRWLFVEEEIFPVCSPRLLERSGPITDVQALARLPLLHLEERYRPRMNWSQWLAHFGVRLPPDPQNYRFNDYSIVLQAAMEGQGVAQGWRHIVAPLIAQGLLVQPLPQRLRTDQAMYIIAPAKQPLREAVRALKDWLVSEAQGMP